MKGEELKRNGRHTESFFGVHCFLPFLRMVEVEDSKISQSRSSMYKVRAQIQRHQITLFCFHSDVGHKKIPKELPAARRLLITL